MLINKQETTVTFTKEASSYQEFLANFFKAYANHKEYHIIINLFSIEKLTANDLLEFLEVSKNHKNNKKSFVIITDDINIESLPDDLIVVPTLQEAIDIIEMEEIERDLDF